MKTRSIPVLISAAVYITSIIFSSACGPTRPPAPDGSAGSNAMPTLPAIATPGPDMLWKTYRNDDRGFTFEYPAIYDEAPYSESCGLKESSDGVHLGHQIDLLFLNSGGVGLAEFTSDLLQSKGWSVDSQTTEPLNGLEAVAIQYRFGGTNRFGSATLVKDGDLIYAFNFSAGGFCEVPDPQASEPNAYSHMLETFRLDQ